MFLFRHKNSVYDAPRNAAFTDISENSIDLIVTNAVMEHIPKRDIKRML